MMPYASFDEIGHGQDGDTSRFTCNLARGIISSVEVDLCCALDKGMLSQVVRFHCLDENSEDAEAA